MWHSGLSGFFMTGLGAKMFAMNKKVSDFLTKHRVCSWTTMLPDGTPHAAAVHFSHKDKPLELYTSTRDVSKKSGGLLKGEIVPGSVVIGFSEEEWITLQMDGEVVAITDKAELAKIHKIHYSKHPNSEKYKDDPDTLFLKFTPKWWRYTDFNAKPPKILSSEK